VNPPNSAAIQKMEPIQESNQILGMGRSHWPKKKLELLVVSQVRADKELPSLVSGT
jgi:hypothetical protein